MMCPLLHFLIYFSVDTLKEQLLTRGEDLVWDKVSV